MPNKPAAAKALRQTKKHTARNLNIKKNIEVAVRLAKKSIIAGEKATTEKVKLAIKNLDRAAQKGVIKKNTAARKKSRLMKTLNKSKAKK